jgi:hypothetical protein
MTYRGNSTKPRYGVRLSLFEAIPYIFWNHFPTSQRLAAILRLTP